MDKCKVSLMVPLEVCSTNPVLCLWYQMATEILTGAVCHSASLSIWTLRKIRGSTSLSDRTDSRAQTTVSYPSNIFPVLQLRRHGRSGGGHRQPILRHPLREDPPVHHGARRQAPQQTPDGVLRLSVRVRQDGRGGGGSELQHRVRALILKDVCLKASSVSPAGGKVLLETSSSQTADMIRLNPNTFGFFQGKFQEKIELNRKISSEFFFFAFFLHFYTFVCFN